MRDREKLKKAEKKMWKLLRKLYNKGYLSSLGFEEGSYHFSFLAQHLTRAKRED